MQREILADGFGTGLHGNTDPDKVGREKTMRYSLLVRVRSAPLLSEHCLPRSVKRLQGRVELHAGRDGP